MRDVFNRLLTTPEQEAEKLSYEDLQTRLETSEQELSRTQNEIAELEQQLQELQEIERQREANEFWEDLQNISDEAIKEQKEQERRAKEKAKIEALQDKIKNLAEQHKVDMLWAEMRNNEKIDEREERMNKKLAKLKKSMNKKLAKLKEHYKLMQARQQERRQIKRKHDKAIRAINRMAKSENIIWNRQQEIKALLQNIDAKALNKLSLEDLLALHNQVQKIYNAGKQELAEKRLLRHERISKLRDELKAVLRPEWEKRPLGAVRSRDDINKEYKGVRGAASKVIDWVKAKTLGAQRFFDSIDDGKATFTGAWVKTFVDSVNAAYDNELLHKFTRLGNMEKIMQDLGITPQMLTQKRNVDVPHRHSRGWTVDELMSIYAGMKNERSKTAILYGNFEDAESIEQAQEWAAKCIEALTDTEKQLADKIIQEYESHFDRINNALIDIYNKGMEHETNYTPMRRLEYTASNKSMVDPDTAEQLLSAQTGSGMGDVQRGFSISRKKIGQHRQSAIDLGLLNIWHSQIEAQEHAAAFGQLVRDLRSVLLGRDGKSEAPIRQMIKYVHGQPAWDMVRRYFNIIANDDVQNAYDTLEGISQFMAKNMSIAYLCGNLGTMLKQMGSFPRVIPHAKVSSIINAIGQFMQNPKQFLESCYELDPQLRNRKGDAFIEALQNNSNALYQGLLKFGSTPIGWVDRATSAIVFKAVYDTNIKRGLSQNEAVKEAQRVVLLTQPAYNIKDKPLIWQQHGIARLMMMFTNDMAQTFGITLYDMTQAIRRGDVKATLATVTGLTLATMLIKMLSGGLPDDPYDPEEWVKWIASAFTENFINSIPLIGKELVTLWDAKNSYFQHNSAFVAPIAKLVKGVNGLWDDKKENNEQAIFNLIEGGSLLVPFPATALRRLYNMLKYSGQGDVINAIKAMVGTHIENKKLRRRLRAR